MNSRLSLILVIAVLLAAAAGAGTILGSGIGRGLPAQVAFQVATTGSPIAFQGVLKGTKGEALDDGVQAVTFAIYSAAEGGRPLWQESQKVSTADGLFSTMLGISTPINPKLMGTVSETYLDVTVGSDTEMAPRMRLATCLTQ